MAFSDDFEGAGATTNLEDWTPSGGTEWTLLSGGAGGCSVTTSGYLRTATAANGAYACDDQGSANMYVEYTRGPDTGNSFIVARVTNENNYIGVRVTTELQLYKNVAASFTELGTATAPSSGDSIRMELDGDDIEVFVNDVSVITATAADHNTVTRAGVSRRATHANGIAGYFESGVLAAGGTIVPIIYHHRRLQGMLG